MDLGLKGKYALVTGGTHGIGLATAIALADQGCHVAVCARDGGRLAAAVAQLERHGVKTLGMAADVLRPGDSERVMQAIASAWGALHVLVNNVGGGGRWGTASIVDTGEDVWRDVYEKNAMAALRFTRLAIPLMRTQRWGRVVTVASIYGRETGARPWYSVAKSAEIALMKSLASDRDLVRDGITFNTVAPGPVMIAGTGIERQRAEDPAGFDRWVDTEFPLGRLAVPEDVAAAILFLCSERAAVINGACLPVDGGQSRSF